MSLRYKGAVLSATPPTVNAETYGSAKGIWTMQQQYQYEGAGTWPSPFTPEYVEDVFSTYLYNGTGATQTITNGIDLSGEGGMVWIKCRNDVYEHKLTDTARGVELALVSNSTAAQASEPNGLTAFTSSGFTVGSDNAHNANSQGLVSWTFRKAAKFFDVVTYTGNGSTTRDISHALGSSPGCIIVKRTDSTSNWPVWHVGRGNNTPLRLNASDTGTSLTTVFPSAPTSTVFTVGTAGGDANYNLNANGATYVAYLFAHDAGGFGDAGDQSIIKCGSYTGNATAGNFQNLGWEPQWLMIKNATTSFADQRDNWVIIDNIRGIPANYDSDSAQLYANLSNAESSTTYANVAGLTATGFNAGAQWNESGTTYIYIAIRRGPMKTPTDATKVFTPTVYTGTNVDNRLVNTTIAPDFVMIRQRNDTVVPGMYTGARLTGNQYLITGSTAVEGTDADSFDAQLVSSVEYGNAFSSMSGVWVGNDATRKFNANTTSNNHIIHSFKRAPGFFDVVCYTGDNTSSLAVSHNLGVIPELMIVRRRSQASNWYVYHKDLGNTQDIFFTSAVPNTSSTKWASTTPTSSVFYVGDSGTTNLNVTQIAILFASCPGVSKVGTYTGNGSTQTINCGFTAGARYILVKRTDSADDWAVFDSARGIVASSDPYLQLNAAAAEVTNQDIIDSDSSGFIVNTNDKVNANGGTYIYLAIA